MRIDATLPSPRVQQDLGGKVPESASAGQKLVFDLSFQLYGLFTELSIRGFCILSEWCGGCDVDYLALEKLEDMLLPNQDSWL